MNKSISFTVGWVLALSMGACTVGCSGTPGYEHEPTNTDGGTVVTTTDAGPVVHTYGDGRVEEHADGSLVDTLIATPCTWLSATDGVVRCLPESTGVVTAGWVSNDCQGRTVQADVALPVWFTVESATGTKVCKPAMPYDHVFVYTGDTDGGTCATSENLSGHTYYYCDTLEKAEDFVAQTEVDK